MYIVTRTLESGTHDYNIWLHRTLFEVMERDTLVADRVITRISHMLETSNRLSGCRLGDITRDKEKHIFEMCFSYCKNDYHLSKFGIWEQYVEHILQEVNYVVSRTDFRRDTNTTLMKAIYTIAQRQGYADAYKSIEEYFSPEDKDVYPLTNYEFDFRAVVNYGCEGTWLNCYLHGDFGVPNKKYLSMGTFKTLNEDLEASRILGELGGILTYLAGRYIRRHLWRFDPKLLPLLNATRG